MYRIYICIPDSFYAKISHQSYDYKINILNSQHNNTNSKVDKGFWYTKINLSKKYLLINGEEN